MSKTDNHITIASEIKKIWKILEEVFDPEVPILSVTDLGIVRDVKFDPDIIPPLARQKNNLFRAGRWGVYITPTYSGCPAMGVISMNIKLALLSHGYQNVKVNQVLSPAWTTEWMTEKGKQKLKEYGIAPPNVKQQVCREDLFADEAVQCPRCHSYHTHRISEFGSTACKALYQCDDCKEPFDYFKCH
jgi:ring-1,2-phenylacetyl-CoA epoxidase subunit PaaD